MPEKLGQGDISPGHSQHRTEAGHGEVPSAAVTVPATAVLGPRTLVYGHVYRSQFVTR